MRRRKKQIGGNLDSLLDTMTNVVGILVVVLIVTQLGVRDAVDQISVKNPIDPKLVVQTEAEVDKLGVTHDKLAATLMSFKEDKRVNPKVLIAKLKHDIVGHKADIKGMTWTVNDDRAKAEQLRDDKNRIIEQYKKEEDEIKKRLADAQDSLARLRAQLDTTPQREVLPAKVVHLPNPRPAPKDAKPVVFLCREGRISFVNTLAFQDKAQKRAAYLVQQRRLGRDPKKGIDGDVLTKEFNRRPLRDRDFDLGLAVHGGRWPRIVLNRKKNGGETAEEIPRENSYYQQGMKRIDPRKFYAQFVVWPDSFEAYLEARRIAAKHGILAGWQPQEMKGEYTVPLGGPIRIGPPPPPKPKPPPDQGKPTPPPKPPPVDTID